MSDDGNSVREGEYPPPPFWPKRLTGAGGPVGFWDASTFLEIEGVEHTYIADGWPGPCWTVWNDEEFAGWFPALSIERAERGAAR